MLPEKKAIGNKDMLFLQDRTFYLQRFLRKMSRFEFIIESQEFLLFSRPQGMNVQKALEKLPPMSTSMKFERLQTITNISIEAYDIMKKESLANRITEFTYFYKVVEPLLNKVKSKTAAMMRTKQQQMNSYQDFHRSMQRYEDLNLQTYTEM